jgi:ATP-dependent DNA helicase RecG
MNIDKLESLIAQGETSTIEFKASTANIRAAFETACAFLNSKGGNILIGVKNNGQIIGQIINDKTKLEIAHEIKKIEPATRIEISYINVKDNKRIISIQVDAGSYVPYAYDGRAFERCETQTNKMSQHRYEQLLIKRGQLNHSWEEFNANDYDIDSLDHEEIYRTVMDGVSGKRIHASVAKDSMEKILRQLGLFSDGKLKNAAVALFAKEIKYGYTQRWLKMARFKGNSTSGDFIDNQQIHSNVFHMLEEVDNFMKKHLPIASYFKPNQFKRIDKPALPILAIREALVNAICHRDYSDRTGYISIAIFDDRVEIWNNGTLSNKLQLEDLKRKHDSVLRNELIAKIFYLRGFIETWGTGTIRMIDFCKEDGIPSPKFTERTSGFLVTFKFSNSIGSNKFIDTTQLTARQQEILNLLSKNSLNGAQIVENLEEHVSVRIVQKDLIKLEIAGLVNRTGKARGILWFITK